MHLLAIQSLSVRHLRNLTSVDVELGPRFNVVSGDNGQGKTNLLEAVYLLATSRSFRTAKLTEAVEWGERAASVRGVLLEEGGERQQSMGLEGGTRVARMDGRRPATLAAYAVRTPVVVFHPGTVSLSAGPGAERRRLLDRVALYVSPASLAESAKYTHALRSRQRVLELRGERAAELDHWEELVVRHGLAVMQAREDAAGRIVPAAEDAFAEIGPRELVLHACYERSAPADAVAFQERLASSRAVDRARGSARVGPHRDDLALTLQGRPVRGLASQGQHRAVVLALELAEIRVVSEARGVRPILLLDEVSSELDRGRTSALMAALRLGAGQVVLTTTRPELIELGAGFGPDDRRDFAVTGGQLAPL